MTGAGLRDVRREYAQIGTADPVTGPVADLRPLGHNKGAGILWSDMEVDHPITHEH